MSAKVRIKHEVLSKNRKTHTKSMERHLKGQKSHRTEYRTRNEAATSMDKKMARLRAMRKKK